MVMVRVLGPLGPIKKTAKAPEQSSLFYMSPQCDIPQTFEPPQCGNSPFSICQPQHVTSCGLKIRGLSVASALGERSWQSLSEGGSQGLVGLLAPPGVLIACCTTYCPFATQQPTPILAWSPCKFC